MKTKRILSLLLTCALILQMGIFTVASAAGDYTETPTTQYGKDFIAACEGQQWRKSLLLGWSYQLFK
jgi:hypothetical protein